ncbi:MAG: nucleotidyltransferase domain-containing protein [Candidatus Kapaibacterium sp.]
MIKTDAERKDLIERAKELNCLYHVDEALKDLNVSYQTAFSKILAAIPPGWQFPEITSAKIVVDGREYVPDGFRETLIRQYSDIVVDHKIAGRITVYYTKMPDAVDPARPFLPEEKKLLNAISDKIGKFVFHKKLKDTFGAWDSARRTLDELRKDHGRLFKLIANTDLDQLKHYLESPPQDLKSAEELEARLEANSRDHWQWRMEMASEIAARLAEDSFGRREFGIAAIYITGSVKNAESGPGSDIDLIVHHRGSPDQLRRFEVWIDGWSLCLAGINRRKTGYPTHRLIDLHIVTDEDIENKTCWAAKLTSTEDRAEPLAILDSGSRI